MKINNIFILNLFLALALSACTNTRIPSQANMPVDHLNIQHRKDVANQLFKQHDYHESLVQWKILRSIQPDNSHYKNRIRVLEALIKRRLKVHLNSANAAFEKKDFNTAEWEFLRVLALDPEHPTAIKILKHIEANKVVENQSRKTDKLIAKQMLSQKIAKEQEEGSNEDDIEDKEDEQALFYLELGIDLFNKQDWSGSIREINKYLPTNPTDKKAIQYLTTSHLNLSKTFEDRGHLEPAIQHIEDIISLNKTNKIKYRDKQLHLKQKLSANYYIEGVKVYRDNIDQAIGYWRRAIATNPDNEKASLRLKKAEKMKENLNDIQPNQ